MRIGDLLVAQGLVSTADLEAALVRKRTTGRQLGANLIAMGRLTPEQLATVLNDQRDLANLPSCEQALVKCERTLGPDHPNTSRARYNLARLRLAAGDAATALTLCRDAIAAQQRTLGPDHPWTGASERLAQAALRALTKSAPASSPTAGSSS